MNETDTEPMLLSPSTPVTCPGCQQQFSLEQGFARRALENLASASQTALAAMHESVRAQAQSAATRAALGKQQELEAELARANAAAAQQGAAFNRSIEAMRELERRHAAIETDALKQTLAQRDAQVAAMLTQELALRRDKAQLEARAAALDVEVARKVDAARNELELRVRTQEQERSAFEIAELHKKLIDVNSKLDEAQRQMAQGSQQLQGEVLELALEEQLRQAFPVDAFAEVRKGARGADLVQRVTTRSLQVAGTMLWEAKRAREWGRDWPAKLKQDMRLAGADIGILVTTTLPREIEVAQAFGLHEDIWVVTWAHAVPLACALRERVLEVYKQRTVSAGKGEKMEALYDYLTSAQFAQKLKAVYGAFRSMQDDLQKERSAAEQRWARREKQITTGMKELLGFAGDVQGLAQQELPQLEMEDPTA